MGKSTRSKGTYSVRVANNYYRSLGYVVDEVEKTGRFRKFKDLYSEHFQSSGYKAGFDCIAIHKTKRPILIQVTTTKPKVHKPFHWFKGEFPKLGVEQYVRKKRGTPDWRVEYLSKSAKITHKI